MLVALLAIGSRTGLLTAGLAVGVLIAARSRLPGARFVRPLALIGVSVALLLPVTTLTDSTITDPDSRMVSKAVSFRSAMWELGRDAWDAAPWDGWGPSSTFMQGAVARPGRYDGLPKDDHPHNIVLATGSSLGWPGLAGLALLAYAGLRHRFGRSLMADGATAGLLATWAANGPDMGGAATTLYPALAFLGLAVGEAARQEHDEPVAATADRARPGLVVLAAGFIVIGLLRTGHEHAVLKASRLLERHADEPSARDDALTSLDRVAAWSTLDPRVSQLRAQAHGLAPVDDAAQQSALLELLERAPYSSRAQHRVAQLHLQLDPDDTRADELLDRALELDPWGPDAWRVQLDRSLVAATRGDRERAFASFVETLLLNPAAAGLVGWNAATRKLHLSADPDGRRVESFALERVLAEIDRRRADRAELDPPYGFRLRMREIEILQELDAWDEADAAARELLVDAHPAQIARRLAGSAMRTGDWHEAIARLREVGLHGNAWAETDLLECLSHAEPLDLEAFEEAWALLQSDMVDVLFEPSVLRRSLAARQRVAERSLDTEAAATWAERVAYANR
jgi:tetratricopeptide (TPR) repeat protein